jgi:anti-anti-sigma regulatory factor
MLRLTWYRDSLTARLKAEGEIAGPECRVFREECRKGMAGEGRLEIDLRGVSYMENAVADDLLELVRLGVNIVDCSAFVWAMLHHEDCCSAKKRRRNARGPRML